MTSTQIGTEITETAATTATTIATELFPELTSPADVEALLGRLEEQPAVLFGSLLESAGALVDDESRPAAASMVRWVEGRVDLQQSFAPFLLHAVSGELVRLDALLEDEHLLEDVTAAEDRDALLAGLAGHLAVQVHELALRPLVAMLRRAARAGTLVGETPEARYVDFAARTLTPAFEADLAEEFPLLVPVLRRACRRSVDHAADVLRHLHADRDALAGLGIAAGDPVRTLDFAASDRHRRGLSVTVLTFASGAKVVHKPRDLSVDGAFQLLLEHVNDVAGTDLRTCGVEPRDGYGWMEFVITGAVPHDARLAYFERVGQLTAVLHLLQARDMHHSNVVCDGVGPVAIDLETLLHPTLRRAEGTDDTDDTAGSPEPGAGQVLDTSVQAIGLLPTMVANGSGGRIDLGGVGYRDGVLSPYRSLVVHQRSRDDMTLGLEQVVLRGRQHAPTVTAQSPDVPRVADATDRGFRTVWDAMAARRDEVADLVGELFDGGRVRYIHNPTAFYAQLQRLVSGPRFYGDLSDRRTALQRVGLSRSEEDPGLARSELRDLAQGDVPYFSATVDATTVLDATDAPVGDLLAESPLAATVRRIRTMGVLERERQRHLLRLTFVGKLPHDAERTATGDLARLPRTDGPDRGEALRLAETVAARLVARQLPGVSPTAPATWIDPMIGTTVEEEAWYPGVLGTGLYNGSLGPAIFLAEAARLTGTPAYAVSARRVLEPLAALVHELDGEGPVQPVGAFAGLAGAPYALAVGGVALDEPALVDAAVQALPLLRRHLAADRTYDLISGAGGLLAVALAVHDRARTPAQRAVCLGVAGEAADHLVQHHTWGRHDTDPVLAKGYTGFGHGTAGLHPYLRRLAALTPGAPVDGLTLGTSSLLAEERARVWLMAADRMARHTRSAYDPGLRDWVRQWPASAEERRSYGWCHGAPGIGLGHALVAEHGLAAQCSAEDEMAAATWQVTRRGLGNNLTYCHGDTGNVEALARIAAVTGHDALARTAGRLAARLVHDVVPHHLASRSSRYSHTACLMLGASGVGHFLLRQVDPTGVPSVLTLD